MSLPPYRLTRAELEAKECRRMKTHGLLPKIGQTYKAINKENQQSFGVDITIMAIKEGPKHYEVAFA